MLTAVSLFAGIGGIDRALELAGVRVVAAVEKDPAARGVLADRFPDVTLFNDVCEVSGDDLRPAGFVPDRGIVTAGWPCQDLSVAGRRLGLGGARSGLFWEVVRLLGDLRPRWFILENVPGLLSAVCSCPGLGYCGGWVTRDEWGHETFHPCDDPHALRGGACGYDGTRGRCMELHGGAMGAVVGALADLGYGLAWRVLDAQHFGVPQRRRRVVFVGYLGDGAAPVQVLLEPEGGRRDPAPRRAAGQGTAVVAALRAGSGGGCGPDDNDATGGRLIAGPLQAEGSGGRGHRIDAEGAANGHLVAATLIAGSHSSCVPGRRREDDENVVLAPTLTNHHGRNTPDQELLVPVAFDAAQNLGTVPAVTAHYGKGPDSDATDALLPVAFDAAQITHPENRVNPQPGDPAMPLAATGQSHVAYALRADPGGTGQGHNINYVTHALAAEGADASEDGTGRGTPLVPMSLAVGQDFATGEDIAMAVTGSNGQPGTVAVPVAFDWQTDGSDRTRPNISTERTSSLQTEKRDAIAAATAVRRLTPVECERLQGFPDGWTATSNGKSQSDSARYRELGNAVAVPVFAWVSHRLAAVHAAITGEPIEPAWEVA